MDVAELWEVDPDSLTDAELSALVQQLDAQRSRVEVAMARAVAAWDARMVWANDGATSGTAWLASRCELSRGSAATLVRTARRLRLMPLTEAAAGRGELGGAKVVLLANAAGRSETAAKAFERDEEMLVTHAHELTVDQTAQFLRHWLLRADPDGGRGDANGDGDRLHVSTTFDGATALDGMYTSEDGAVIKAAVDAEYERLWRAERESDGLTRTAAQRRAAALAEMIRRAVGAERGRPTLSVTISLDDLVSGVGPAAVDATGEPLHPATVRRMACDASIIPVVLGGSGEVLDYGRARRTVSTTQRRALTLRDRGCVFPGCDRPPGWCEGHHIVPWPAGGTTDLANLALLCNHHHKAMHEGGWAMARAPDGSLSFARPDGTPLLATRLAS